MQKMLQQVVAWFKSYQQAYEQINPPAIYRIVDIKKNQKHETILTVQVIGKAVIFHYSPIDIVRDDRLLEGFSKRDIRTITWFAQQELTAPKYTVTTQMTDGDQTVFRLQKVGDTKYIEKHAQEISLDPEMMKSLSAEDAHLIGYVSASEKTVAEMLLMRKKRDE
jgi:hypothetical protein